MNTQGTDADNPEARQIDQKLENVPCTRCGEDQSSVLYTLEDYLYKAPGHFAMRECQRCGLIFLSPRPLPSVLADYYPYTYAPYRRAIQDEKSSLMRWMRRRRIRMRRQLVERFTTQGPGRLLDIGASTGIFMDEMRSNGWQVLGIELSEQAASYARERFGLEMICTELSQADLPNNHFDLITLWDVIEHTFDPAAVLSQVYEQLDQAGIVALTIPSWESLDRRLFGRYWVGFDAPRHLHVFTQRVIEEMLKQAGFTVEENRTTFGGYFTFVTSLRTWLRAHLPPGWLLNGLEKVIDLHGIRFLFEPFFLLMDWLGWGGVRVIVARKSEFSRDVAVIEERGDSI
jgi:SAM-dependent methyltransferase